MHLSTLAPAILAPSLAAAAAATGNFGFALGDKNADGSCKAQADYEADFAAIANASDARIVRIYAASDCDTAQNILPAAKTGGFQVVLGIWCVHSTFYSSCVDWLDVVGPAFSFWTCC